jgi:hypothetical protein
MPIVEPIQISMLYLLYQHFERLYFKDLVNTYSYNFYVIGKNYLGIKPNIIEKILPILTEFDSKYDFFQNKYPNNLINR